MLARHIGAAFAALVFMLALTHHAAPQSLAPIPVPGAMIDDRFAHLREPEAHASARALLQDRPARAARRHHKRVDARLQRAIKRVHARLQRAARSR
jgi:hypothetical protein